MSDLEVVRWRKYGKDRLYVRADDGTNVGWVDLQSGAVNVQLQTRAADLHAAIAAHCATTGLALPTEPAPHVPSDPTVSPVALAPTAAMQSAGAADDPLPRPVLTIDGADLAANRPGQGIRELAEAERTAMWQRNKLVTVAARVLDTNTQERRWRVGADGEEAIGTRLNKLEKHGWRVLHSVPVGQRDADIDHVLIGPGGVFTINTKRHPNKSVVVRGDAIRVDGQRRPYVPKSRHEAARAAKLLTHACGFPVEVKGVLVFLTGTLFPDVTIKKAPGDVYLLDRMDVPGAFRRTKHRLSASTIDAIYEHARRKTTWTAKV